jgi:arsenate reductase
MYIVYGIKNCNTVKKAIDWMNAHKIIYEFHDYKKSGISEDKLTSWCHQKGWEALLNKKGTTYRALEDQVKNSIVSEKEAIKLMLDKNSIIKRPVVEQSGKIIAIGFDEDNYSSLLK